MWSIDPRDQHLLEWVCTTHLDYVNIRSHDAQYFSSEIKDRDTSNAFNLVYSHIGIDHDEQPSWHFSPLDDPTVLPASYYIVDLLPDMENAWHVLTHESPAFPDELQIDDINAVAQERSLLIAVDFSTENLDDILTSLPHIKGICLRLGSPRREGLGLHAMEANTALALLAILHE